VLSKTWRKDRCFEGIIQTSLIVMIPTTGPCAIYFSPCRPFRTLIVECNGKPISLPKDNPLSDENGIFRVPNLNETPKDYTGGGKFLRGGKVSGNMQDGTIVSGITEMGGNSEFYTDTMKGWQPSKKNPFQSDSLVFDDLNRRYSYKPGLFQKEHTKVDGYRTRPVNMSVVWIIRVQ
jgi:hypothetical protein